MGRLAQSGSANTAIQLELLLFPDLAPLRTQSAVERSNADFADKFARAGYRELDVMIDHKNEAIWRFMR